MSDNSPAIYGIPQTVSLPVGDVGIGSYIVNDYLITVADSEDGNGYLLTIKKGSQIQEIHLTELKQEAVDAAINLALTEAKESGEFDGNGIERAVLNSDYTLTLYFTDGTSVTTTPIRGETGNGIQSVAMNPDYTLTITFTDGDIYTTGSIRGLTGNGISAVVLNSDYTLTIRYTDGNSYTTTSIRGAKGDTGVSISGIIFNSDYSLTIECSDGSSYTTDSIRGEKGETGTGISSARLNDDFTLTLNFDDGNSYTTRSIRGETGAKGEKGDPGESFEIHACTSTEYDYNTGIPTIENPRANCLYLVPSSDAITTDLFVEWVYIYGRWEKFGSAEINLDAYAKKTEVAAKLDKPIRDGLSGQILVSNGSGGQTWNDLPVPDWNASNGSTGFIRNKPDLKSGTGADSVVNRHSLVSGSHSMAVGTNNTASGSDNFVTGNGNNAKGSGSILGGNHNTAELRGSNSVVGGTNNLVSSSNNLVSGTINNVGGNNSVVGGSNNVVSGSCSLAVGDNNTASGTYSTVEGSHTTATMNAAHAEGTGTTASGDSSHAEGNGTTASGKNSHAEGSHTTASGTNSHAEGGQTESATYYSHAEGYGTSATGSAAHAEGNTTIASGINSHAEGTNTLASGINSHAEGQFSIANHKSQHVFGENNIEDPSTAAASARGNYVEIVGNGYSSNDRSNARTLDWNGNEWIAGNFKMGGNSYDDPDAKELATVDFVESNAPDWEAEEGDPGYIANKPAIEAGTGTISMQNTNGPANANGNYSFVFGRQSAYAVFYLTGEAGATVYSYKDLPISSTRIEAIKRHAGRIITEKAIANGASVYDDISILSIDTSEHTITLEKTLSEDEALNEELARLYICPTANGTASTAFGYGAVANSNGSFAIGSETIANGNSSFASGLRSISIGTFSASFGRYGIAGGNDSFVNATTAYGLNLTLSGEAGAIVYSFTENYTSMQDFFDVSISNGLVWAAENKVVAIDMTNKTITFDHTLSEDQAASSSRIFIMFKAFAIGAGAHAEGAGTIALGGLAHAEGYLTIASGYFSHAEGYLTIANHANQTVSGLFNIPDPNSSVSDTVGLYLEIVGNGDMTKRSNARTLDRYGNEWIQGTLKMGGESQDDPEAIEVATVETAEHSIIRTTEEKAGMASFSDGADNIPVRSMKISFEPKQDFGDYDHAWGPGQGKNKFQNTLETVTKVGTTFTRTIEDAVNVSDTPTEDTQVLIGNATLSAGNYILSGSEEATEGIRMEARKIVGATEEVLNSEFTLDSDQTIYVYIVVTTAFNGETVTFWPMIREASETDDTYEPYANICPITGHTGVDIYHKNRNLWSGIDIANDFKRRLPSAVIDTEEETVRFANNASITTGMLIPYKLKADNKIKENTVYTIVLTISKNSGTGTNVRVYYTDDTYSNFGTVPTTNTKSRVIFRTSASKTFNTLTRVNQSGTTTIYYNESGMFEGNLSDEEVLKYLLQQSSDTSYNWTDDIGTLYGGYLEPNTGVFTKTYDCINNYNGETLPGKWVSSMDTYAPGTTPSIGAQVVYELSEPVTYELTPTDIRTFDGYNSFWTNNGTITEITYYANKRLYDLIGEIADEHQLVSASSSDIKTGTDEENVITPMYQHESAFYGLAKAAGDTTQSASSNPVGTYTEEAKSAISEMLGGSVSVDGTAPTINAKAGIRYVCGEILTLDITLPASGIVDVVFTSGSTPTVLTITPPTGQTVKWANGFDPTSLDTDTTYEINVMDGLGVAASWT